MKAVREGCHRRENPRCERGLTQKNQGLCRSYSAHFGGQNQDFFAQPQIILIADAYKCGNCFHCRCLCKIGERGVFCDLKDEDVWPEKWRCRFWIPKSPFTEPRCGHSLCPLRTHPAALEMEKRDLDALPIN